jgi:transcriptional antiterminator NusG
MTAGGMDPDRPAAEESPEPRHEWADAESAGRESSAPEPIEPASKGEVPADAETSAESAATGAKDKPEDEMPAAADDTNAAGETDGEAAAAKKSDKMDWYILKVQSNREESIRDGLLRRVKVAGLDEYFDEVIVPTETVSEYKDGKRRTRKQKLWPGYLVVHMEINEETWFLVRETPGIGDFTGAGGKPTPMLATEVEKILRLVHPERHAAKEKAPVKIAFEIGDRVKIKEGTFQNFDGEVCALDHANGRVTVMTEIFSRKTPVEFDYWQIERI